MTFVRIARTAVVGAVTAVLVVATTSCNARQPLVVQDPDVVPPSIATGPNSLPYLRSGTLGDFAIALAGGADQANNAHEGIADLGAIFTDEFNDYDTYPTRNALNTRTALPDNLTLTEVFQNLGSVHNDARRALDQYKLYGATQIGRAEMYSVDAYVYILVAEHWCSGEPFSLLDAVTGKVTNSQFLTTTQMLDTALAELEAAKNVVASDTNSADAGELSDQTNLATVGEARALLDLGMVAQAADTAALVSSGFSYQIQESSNTARQENGVWNFTIAFQAFSVADGKNGTGLPFVSSHDPRVPWAFGVNGPTDTLGSNGQGPFYNQQKYPLETSNMTVADYNEAQLIVAEGDIFAGNYGAARGIMNTLRSTITPLPGFPAPGPVGDSTLASAKDQMLQLLSERAFWMYVTGHRLGDWRRMLRPPYTAAPFIFTTGDVYPVGPGLQATLEFPTPTNTNPNPNFKACDATIP